MARPAEIMQFQAGADSAWCWDVAFKPAEIHDILARHASAATATHDAPVLS